MKPNSFFVVVVVVRRTNTFLINQSTDHSFDLVFLPTEIRSFSPILLTSFRRLSIDGQKKEEKEEKEKEKEEEEEE